MDTIPDPSTMRRESPIFDMWGFTLEVRGIELVHPADGYQLEIVRQNYLYFLPTANKILNVHVHHADLCPDASEVYVCRGYNGTKTLVGHDFMKGGAFKKLQTQAVHLISEHKLDRFSKKKNFYSRNAIESLIARLLVLSKHHKGSLTSPMAEESKTVILKSVLREHTLEFLLYLFLCGVFAKRYKTPQELYGQSTLL